MKINNEIITTYDIEKEKNYLLALNPNLKEIDKNQLGMIAKKSLTKEVIRKNEILKYIELKQENPQIDSVLNSLIKNLNFTDKNEFENYLKEFDISIDDLKKKIEIENEWKNMIYIKYKDSVKIDNENLMIKIDNMIQNSYVFEFNLSEILFTINNNTSYEDELKKIKNSIKDIGFENTANLYSISDSSKIGGKIGWVAKKNLSTPIVNKIIDLKKDQYSEPIKIGNDFLILRINETRKKPFKMNKQAELDKMIMIETTSQLDKFSKIFYNKIKLNAKISEF
ncbi:peptidylprolyl isomerase [Candidatus Pelagibacter sp.]|uniref:peptidylprolyl isomerase n=1 Tax=Candidatus Pelagibacter sp. TaxID=2024849 RepID=UPI003F86F841